jgi:DNA invertase Pin-like site-specific DNA recombinase
MADYTNLTRGHRFAAGRKANAQRDAWTHEELKTLFGSEVWRGPSVTRDARFWLPLLALFHGCRLEEFADLYRRDIDNSNGITFVRLTDEEGRRLKNNNATRNVPLHPELVRLGFLDHVDYGMVIRYVLPSIQPQGPAVQSTGLSAPQGKGSTHMATKAKRAALYLRVSTDGQTTENQRLALSGVAERRGWTVVKVYEDAGISGAKGRDRRPGFDAMLKDATRRRFDVLMFWSIDRLGGSTAMVATALAELEAAGVSIYADKEAMDATTPHGRAMLQMAAVFAELERGMIRERVMAGLERAKAQGVRLGRPKVAIKVEDMIRERLVQGHGMLRIARELGVGVSTVQRVKGALAGAASPTTAS